MTVLHQSTAKLAIDCLMLYCVSVIHKLDRGGVFADIGTACHAAVEAGYRGSATGNRPPLQYALEGLEFWLQQHPEKPPRVRMEAEKIIRFAYSDESSLWLQLPGRGQKIVVEQRWAMDAEFNAVPLDSEDIAYAGTIDQCEWGPQGVFLRDHKTIMRRLSNEDLQDDMQGWLYGLWALSNFNAPSVTWSLNLLRFGYAPRVVLKRGDPWERRAKALFTSLRERVMRAEREDDWPATPGLGCTFCPIAGKCDEYQDLVAIGAERDDEPIETTAVRYLAMKKRHAADKRKLEKHCDENAEIPVGHGKVLGFKPSTKTEWTHPLVDLLECLRADGASHEDLVRWFPKGSVSKDAMTKAVTELMKRGEIEQEQEAYEYVDGLRETLPSTKFTAFIPAKDE